VSLPARVGFVILVAATFAAFFVAQRLKSAPAVAALRNVVHQFSPNGDGKRDALPIRVRVRKDDDVTISIVDAQDTEVRRVATAVPAHADQTLRMSWDGRTDDGKLAPEGFYRVRVSLRRGGRAVTLRPQSRLDVTPPHPTVFAGGSDGTKWITGPVAGRVPFRVVVVSDHFPTRMSVLRTGVHSAREVDSFELRPGANGGEWDGQADGKPAPPGNYQLVAHVRDRAGNVGSSAPPVDSRAPVRGAPGVSVRGLLAQPPADPVRAGEKATFAVDSRGRPFTWRMFRVGEPRATRKGQRDSGGEFRLKVPDGKSGLYVFDVRTNKRRTAVPFAVQDATPAPILVVLPAVTWFGRDLLDDDRDGRPNTLENGSAAGYPRLLAPGMPDGFYGQVAPLAAFLDGQGLGYDVTTDLTLAATTAGLTGERQGVLLAGPLRWISTDVAKRLRRYVVAGGRVASFGTGSMLRGVSIGRARLVRPLPPVDSDPFGTRLRPQRTLKPGTGPLQPIADEGGTGLLTGVEELPGFSVVEESDPSDHVQAALAAVDQDAIDAAEQAGEALPDSYPALALTQLGDGLVIRVGLPQWGAKLKAGSTPVQQLTRNIADILAGHEPKIRTF
jgi:hypothetical protein